MRKIFQILTFISLIVLFLSGSLYTTTEWRSFHPHMLIGSMALLVFVALLHKVNKFKFDSKIFLIFFLFFLFGLISTLLNSDYELMTGMFSLLYLYLSLVVVLPAVIKKNKQDGKKIIVLSLLTGHFFLIIPSLFLEEVSTRSYRGIFYNPNSLGTVVATIFIIFLARILILLEGYIEEKKIDKISFLFNLFFLIGSFILAVFSSSRTSFLAIIIVTLLSSLIFLGRFLIVKNFKIVIKKIYIKRLVFLLFFILMLGMITLYFTSIYDVLYEGIFSKFEAKADDVFDKRLDIWSRTIENINLFGYGREYSDMVGRSAHNTFFSVLGQFGLISFLFFILFILGFLIKSIKYVFFEVNNNYKYLPFLSIILFILLSMGEGMMLKTSMLLMFATVGFINNK